MIKSIPVDLIKDITDKDKIIDLLKQDINDYTFLNENMKNNKEVALFVVKKNALFIRFMGNELKDDKEVAMIAVSKNYFALLELSDRLKQDMDIIKASIKHDTRSLKHLPLEYRDNKELALVSLCANSPYMNLYSNEIQNVLGEGNHEDKTHRLIKAIASQNLAQKLKNSLFNKPFHKNTKV